jgi:hypothetical protein
MGQSSKDHTKAKLLAAACVAILCVILVLGLWPFHAPRNAVTWLQNGNGLQFGDYATVLSAGEFKSTAPQTETSRSIEIWIKSRSNEDWGMLLAFHTPGVPLQFSLLETEDGGLSLDGAVSAEQHRTRAARVYVADVFRPVKLVFITITSGTRGTQVYADGVLIGTASYFRPLGEDFAGRLIVGDSPGQNYYWPGQVRGVAIYDSQLTPQQVLQNYQAWKRTGQPELAAIENCIALYLFDEHSGRVVHNRVNPETDLYIPEKYVVLDQILLEPFWKEFNLSWGYWMEVLKNVAGFMPLGFCFYAYLLHRIKRAALVTVILGGTVSLTIEALQAYLPTRDSGMTDIITNTLGTYLGVLSYRTLSAFLDRMVLWLLSIVRRNVPLRRVAPGPHG